MGESYYIDSIKRINSVVHIEVDHLTSDVVDASNKGFVGMSDAYKAQKYRDIYNGKVVSEDFQYFMPRRTSKATLNSITHKDIVSPKVKVLLSMESSRPYDDVLVAINPEATTEREQKETELLKNYTRDQIMLPIQQMVMMDAVKAVQGRELSPEEQQQIQEQIQQKMASMEPKKIQKYMLRDFQTPADVAGNQVLNFLKSYRKLRYKFNQGLKEAAITRYEAYRIFENYGHPDIELIQGENIQFVKSSYSEFIQDADIVVVKHDWTYERIVQEFRDVSPEVKKKLRDVKDKSEDSVFWSSRFHTIMHYMWRDTETAKRIYFKNEAGEEDSDIVDGDYIHDPKSEKVEKFEIDVIHEAWVLGVEADGELIKYGKISSYYDMERPKMPYYGARYEDWFMHRMATYQMLYSIIWYRLETLIAKMRANKLAINAKTMAMAGKVPFDTEKWMSYMNEDDLIILDPTAEGQRGEQGRSVGDLVKEINMTNVSDISALEKLLEYVDYKAGESVGVPKQLEGQIAEREGVANVNKVFNTTLRLLEPYYEMHDIIKDEVTCAMIDKAREMYKRYMPKNLYYVLDDMSVNWIKMDTDVFTVSQYGLFNRSSSKTVDILAKIENVTSLYAQNTGAKFSTLIKVGMTNNPTEALEYVITSENEQEQMAAQKQKADHEYQMALEKEKQKTIQMQHKNAIELVVKKEEERRKTELEKTALLAMGFFPDKDLNKNNIPDVMEQLKILIAQNKDRREEKKLEIMERESNARIDNMANQDKSKDSV